MSSGYFSLVGHVVSGAYIQLRHNKVKSAIDNVWTKGETVSW